jgi:hypothetical protein
MKKTTSGHSFHIPVMGTAFTIDTPIKVAKYGVSSVMSIGDDELCEEMRKHYTVSIGEEFSPIEKFSDDYRAKRITAYLDLVHTIVERDFNKIKSLPFYEDNELRKYFELLPEHSRLKQKYNLLFSENDIKKKQALEKECLENMTIGGIDVNIMTKLDRDNRDKEGNILSEEFSDALSALRGFAKSKLKSSIIFSAGFNRRLFAYIEKFADFFPDNSGNIKKKIILKVSDYRSSLTQGKFLAKKGVWVHEHRIESGLNCGGHAFASEGHLLGPILEEFKQKKDELCTYLFDICNQALKMKNKSLFKKKPLLNVTVQGGIGTYKEDQFLLNHYNVDGTGWATPFLLSPEVTTLDAETRSNLIKATEDDLYLSGISPLGVPFNTVKNTMSEQQKLQRFEEGKPGSPCPKGYLVSNTEFSVKPVCTASIFYQKRKLKEVENSSLEGTEKKIAIQKIIDKACLCEDLAAPAIMINELETKRPQMTAVCPGPNLAYFSREMSFKDLVNHIYGKINVLNSVKRSNMFINELGMYIDFLGKELKEAVKEQLVQKRKKYFSNFSTNLINGMDYYYELIPSLFEETEEYRRIMSQDLDRLKEKFELLLSKYNFHPAVI